MFDDGEQWPGWLQLSKTHLLSGIDENAPDAFRASPRTPLGGGYWPTTSTAGMGIRFGVLMLYILNGTAISGNILFGYADAGSDGSGLSAFPVAATSQIDQKIDDGNPFTGSFRASNDPVVLPGQTPQVCIDWTAQAYSVPSGDVPACVFTYQL
jgi:hypothetical protein